MHRLAQGLRRPALVVLGLVFAACLMSPRIASAQVGNVLSFVKQSDTAGNFTAVLDTGDEFGGAAVSLGDLDGAGPSKQAVAVGCALDDDLFPDAGAVYILFLDAAGGVLSHQKIGALSGGLTGPLHLSDEFGTSIAFLGDLDGAGPSAAAIAVGAPGDDDGGGACGAVYILFLSSAGTVLAEQKISRIAGGFTGLLDPLDEFGGAVAWLGDLDGGRPSTGALAVGAAGDDDGGASRGAVYVLFLSSAGTVLSHQKISALVGGFAGALDNLDEFGSALARLGDLDGAGPSRAALAVGAVFDDDGAPDAGAVWVLFLDDFGIVQSSTKISGTSGGLGVTIDPADEFGGALLELGDMDGAGPGVTTLAVGATGDDDGGFDRGALHLLHLSASGAVVSRAKISNTAGTFGATLDNLDSFGSSVAYLGDLDGAGPSGVAVVVGATGDDDGGGDRGAVYVLYLSGTPTTDAPGDTGGPRAASLGEPTPNPFRRSTRIPFAARPGVRLVVEVRDVAGRLVRRLDGVSSGPGSSPLTWDGRDESGRVLPAGTYFLHLAQDGQTSARSRRAVLLR